MNLQLGQQQIYVPSYESKMDLQLGQLQNYEPSCESRDDLQLGMKTNYGFSCRLSCEGKLVTRTTKQKLCIYQQNGVCGNRRNVLVSLPPCQPHPRVEKTTASPNNTSLMRKQARYMETEAIRIAPLGDHTQTHCLFCRKTTMGSQAPGSWMTLWDQRRDLQAAD